MSLRRVSRFGFDIDEAPGKMSMSTVNQTETGRGIVKIVYLVRGDLCKRLRLQKRKRNLVIATVRDLHPVTEFVYDVMDG